MAHLGPLLAPARRAREARPDRGARALVPAPPAGRIHRLRDLAGPSLIVALPVGIIILQRDLGVAVLTLLIACTYLPFTGIPWRAWGGLAGVGALGLAGLWTFFLKDYQQKRILDFLDPSRDPLASGYQAIQSKIAVGSGGLLGKGWLDGTQTQLRFLPTQHSDFVFSVLAEEWGFVGSVAVLGLYLCVCSGASRSRATRRTPSARCSPSGSSGSSSGPP